MPPRKSNASTTAQTSTELAKVVVGADTSMISNATTAEPTSPKVKKSKQPQQGDDMTIDDLLLPRSLISRISRGVLPPNTSIQKDAILALAKSATVFISHLAAEANDLTDRKTVQSQDVLKAIKEIEMDSVMNLGAVGEDGRTGGRLEREVNMFEEAVRDKRKGYREKVKKTRESEVSKTGDENTSMAMSRDELEDQDVGHQSKKVRRDEEQHPTRDTEMGGIVDNSSSHILGTVDGVNRSQQEDDGDQTETDPEMADANGEDEDSDEEDEEAEEEDDDDDDGNEEGPGAEDDLLDGNASRRKLKDGERLLVPDGTVHLGSEDEDDDSD